MNYLTSDEQVLEIAPYLGGLLETLFCRNACTNSTGTNFIFSGPLAKKFGKKKGIFRMIVPWVLKVSEKV